MKHSAAPSTLEECSKKMQSRETTSLSLLNGIAEHNPQQWERFALLFGPMVYEWCRRARVNEHDSSDLVQEVFRVVAVKISTYQRDRTGSSFQGWLWGITRNKIREYFRQRIGGPVAAGGTKAKMQLDQVTDDDPQDAGDDEQKLLSDDAALLYQRALSLIKQDFRPNTWQAFWRVTVDECPANEVAEELGMTPGAVYNAKYKVMRRLRDEFGGVM